MPRVYPEEFRRDVQPWNSAAEKITRIVATFVNLQSTNSVRERPCRSTKERFLWHGELKQKGTKCHAFAGI